MKNQLRISLTAIFLMFFLAGNSTSMFGDDKKKDVEWKETTHDFGKIPSAIPAKNTFEFTNSSDAPIVISAVKASCGCTSTNYTKTPINPGEKGSIDVSYNARSIGPFNKTIRVTLSSQAELITLRVKGEVIKKQTGK